MASRRRSSACSRIAVRGRVFTEEEAGAGRARVAILSHAFWQRAFATRRRGDRRDIRLNGDRYTIVGVMPEGFAFLDPDSRSIWVAAGVQRRERSEDARYSQNHDADRPAASRRHAGAGTAADRCAERRATSSAPAR